MPAITERKWNAMPSGDFMFLLLLTVTSQACLRTKEGERVNWPQMELYALTVQGRQEGGQAVGHAGRNQGPGGLIFARSEACRSVGGSEG